MVRTMSDVKPEPLQWLWPGVFARAKVTLWGGDPGVGKSKLASDIEARISAGLPLPDGTTAPTGGVIVFSAEDDPADTYRPFLDVAGGDPSRIIHVDCVATVREDGTTERRTFNLERDIGTLRALLADHPDVVFVRIDPVTAYLGRVDSHKNAEVRALLRTWKRWRVNSMLRSSWSRT